MSKTENRIVQVLVKHKLLIFSLIMTLLGLYARHMNLYVVNGDCRWMLEWMEDMAANGGIFALKERVGNYSIPFQFILALLSYIPLPHVIVYKYFITICDLLMSLEAASFVFQLTKDRFKSFLTYAVFFVCPLFVMDSSIWGQCDSIYILFVIASLKYIFKEKYAVAFSFFGLGMAFKLQAIFFLPFLLVIYFCERKFSVKYFFLSLLVFYLACVPGFLLGRSILEPVGNYAEQADLFGQLNLNVFNLWFIGNGGYSELFYIAVSVTALAFGLSLLFMFRAKPINLSEHYLELTIWYTWTSVMFLPAMHDRYTLLAETFLMIICIVKKKYFAVTIVQLLCSLQTYCSFLFEQEIVLKDLSVLLIFAYAYFTYSIFEQIKESINNQLTS